MLKDFYGMLGGGSSVSSIIISVSIILICGFLMTRITKLLKLPNVTAYIIVGIIIGPYVSAFNSLSFSADGNMVLNNSNTDVYVLIGDKNVLIKKNSTTRI